MFTIRRATMHDRDAWLEMRQALWPDFPKLEHVREIEVTITTKTDVVFVAESQSGQVVGFVEASLRSFADGCETSPVGYIEGWFVRSEHRRQGIGQALVAAAEQWAIELGCVEMASDARIENAVSQQSHLAMGYEETGRLVCFKRRLGSSSQGR